MDEAMNARPLPAATPGTIDVFDVGPRPVSGLASDADASA